MAARGKENTLKVENDGQLPYNGHWYPREGKDVVKVDPDLTNNPSKIFFTVKNGDNPPKKIELPKNTTISIDGNKVIAESKILDGVAVFERISRDPYVIDFEFKLRELTQGLEDVFPQQYIDQYFNDLYLSDSVVKINNTMLNNLGILELVIEKISASTILGSNNAPIRITAKENYTGSSATGTTLFV